MIKKLFCYLGILLINVSASVIGMEESITIEGRTLSVSMPKNQDILRIAKWFKEEYAGDYGVAFSEINCYDITLCKCAACYKPKKSEAESSKFVIGLRDGDSDITVDHQGKRAREIKAKTYPVFQSRKEWQYLVQDIINACQDLCVDRINGLHFIERIVQDKTKNAVKHLQEALQVKGNSSGQVFVRSSEDEKFSFSNPLSPTQETTSEFFNMLSNFKALMESNCMAYRHMGLALEVMSKFPNEIDSQADSTVFYNDNEFMAHLLQFHEGTHLAGIKEDKELIINAYKLYTVINFLALNYSDQVLKNSLLIELKETGYLHMPLFFNNNSTADFNQLIEETNVNMNFLKNLPRVTSEEVSQLTRFKLYNLRELLKSRLKRNFPRRLQGLYNLAYNIQQFFEK